MKRVSLPMAGLLFLALLLGLTQRALATTAAEYCAEPQETEFVRLLNDYRAANGVGPVQADQYLSAGSEDHAIDMGQRNVLDHNLANGTTGFDNLAAHGWTAGGWLGEVAAGSDATAAGTLAQLKSDPPHNAILLDPKYVSVGVGRYDDGGATTARYWWVADFSSSSPMQAAVGCGAAGQADEPAPTETAAPTEVATSTPVEPTNTPTAEEPTSAAADSTTGNDNSGHNQNEPKVCPTRNPHYPDC
jgi:uncharacterized protein YkwD